MIVVKRGVLGLSASIAVMLALAGLWAPVASAANAHSSYSRGTERCRSCHFNHTAAESDSLLKTSTVSGSCRMCHDGTGSDYDVEAGTAFGKPAPAGNAAMRSGRTTSAHDLDVTTKAPGGSGNWIEMDCAACHAPHGSENFRNLRENILGRAVSVSADVRPATSTSAEVVTYKGGNVEFCTACHTTYYQDTSRGHYFLRSAGKAEAGSRLICEDCHNSHGSRGTGSILSEELLTAVRGERLLASGGYQRFVSLESDAWDSRVGVTIYVNGHRADGNYKVNYDEAYVQFDAPLDDNAKVTADYRRTGVSKGSSGRRRRDACLACHHAKNAPALYGRQPVQMLTGMEGHDIGLLRPCQDCHGDVHDVGPGDSGCYPCHSEFDPVSGKSGPASDLLSLMGESKNGLAPKVKYHHTITDGRSAGTNSCEVMCHAPHPHYRGAASAGASAHTWLTSPALGTVEVSMAARTDYDYVGAGGGGVCLSCHSADSKVVPSDLQVDARVYQDSLHSYKTAVYDADFGSSAAGDGTFYEAGCAKCHSPHGSNLPGMMRQAIKDTGLSEEGRVHEVKTDSRGRLSDSVCYACHAEASSGLPTSSYSLLAYPFGPATDNGSAFYPGRGSLVDYDRARWPGFDVYAESAHGNKTDAQMRWPGTDSGQGSPYAKDADLSYTREAPVGDEGKCKNCHATHGSSENDMLLAAYSGTAGETQAINNVCFVCHDADGPAQNIYQYYDSDAAGPSAGHALKVGGAGKAAGYKLLCSDCHAPHGSKNGNGAMLSDSLNTSSYQLSAPDDPASHDATCIACHGSPGGNYGAQVAGRVMYGHAIVTTPADHAEKTGRCLHCHGPAHAPSSGTASGDECYSCHPDGTPESGGVTGGTDGGTGGVTGGSEGDTGAATGGSAGTIGGASWGVLQGATSAVKNRR